MILIGISSPSIYAIIIELVPTKQFKIAYSLIYLGRNIGQIISSLLVGIYFEKLNILFLFFTICVILALIILTIFIKQHHNEKTSKSQKTSLTPKHINFKYKYIGILVFIAFIFMEFSFAQQKFSLPLSLQYIFSENGVRYYSYIISYNTATLLVLTPILTQLTNKMSLIGSLICSCLFLSIGFGGLAFTTSLWGIFILTTLWSIAEVIYIINSYVFLGKLLGEANIGSASSFILAARSLGLAFCSLLSSVIIEEIGVLSIWAITFIVAILALVLLYLAKVRYINSHSN